MCIILHCAWIFIFGTSTEAVDWIGSCEFHTFVGFGFCTAGFDGFGEILRPVNTTSGSQGQGGTPVNKQDKLIKSDLDSSLASLAGGLNIHPVGQVKK